MSRAASSRRCTTPGSWTTIASTSFAARASANLRRWRERASAHAGSGYPSESAALTDKLRGTSTPGRQSPRRRQRPAPANDLLGIAAPHVSPEGGSASYAAAYRALPKPAPSEDDGDRIFVVLGTSHYGEPDRFGLTRKPFATPFGIAPTETALVDELCAQRATA